MDFLYIHDRHFIFDYVLLFVESDIVFGILIAHDITASNEVEYWGEYLARDERNCVSFPSPISGHMRTVWANERRYYMCNVFSH